MIDMTIEKLEARIEALEKELAKAQKNLDSIRKRLANTSFLAKAPANVIAGVRESEGKAAALVAQLEESLATLGA